MFEDKAGFRGMDIRVSGWKGDFLERERGWLVKILGVMDERGGMCLVAIVVQVVRCRSWLKGGGGVFERRIDEGLIGLCLWVC